MKLIKVAKLLNCELATMDQNPFRSFFDTCQISYLTNDFIFFNVSWSKNIQIQAIFTNIGVRIPCQRTRKITEKFIRHLGASIWICNSIFYDIPVPSFNLSGTRKPIFKVIIQKSRREVSLKYGFCKKSLLTKSILVEPYTIDCEYVAYFLPKIHYAFSADTTTILLKKYIF